MMKRMKKETPLPDTSSAVEKHPRVLVLGSRTWNDAKFIDSTLMNAWIELGRDLEATLIVETPPPLGGNVTRYASSSWAIRNLPIETYEPNYNDSMEANEEILQPGVDLCIVFLSEIMSTSLWNFLELIEKKNIPIRTYYLDDENPFDVTGQLKAIALDQ